MIRFFLGEGSISWVWIGVPILSFGLFGKRYERIFRKVVASFQEGLNLVKVRIGIWAMLKKACQNNNLGSILHNWEACLASGPFKGKRKKRE